MIIIIPETGSHICMCICEKENRPSSPPDCSCGHRVRACSDSQHPAGALNRPMTLHGSPCSNQISPALPAGREENPQETPSLIGWDKRHGRKQGHVCTHTHTHTQTDLHIDQNPSLPVKELEMASGLGDAISVRCLMLHKRNLHLHSSCLC